ncbi:hypothetical protein ACLBXM_18895 [Xanthobacteraceae bacterium A53D]
MTEEEIIKNNIETLNEIIRLNWVEKAKSLGPEVDRDLDVEREALIKELGGLYSRLYKTDAVPFIVRVREKSGPDGELGSMVLFVAMMDSEADALSAVHHNASKHSIVEGVVDIAADSVVEKYGLKRGDVRILGS